MNRVKLGDLFQVVGVQLHHFPKVGDVKSVQESVEMQLFSLLGLLTWPKCKERPLSVCEGYKHAELAKPTQHGGSKKFLRLYRGQLSFVCYQESFLVLLFSSPHLKTGIIIEKHVVFMRIISQDDDIIFQSRTNFIYIHIMMGNESLLQIIFSFVRFPSEFF